MMEIGFWFMLMNPQSGPGERRASCCFKGATEKAAENCYLGWLVCFFPEPVRARARRSFPSSASGMAFSWINVGRDQPRSVTA